MTSPRKSRQSSASLGNRCALGGCEKEAREEWGRWCSRGCRIIDWIQIHCRIPEGKDVGKRVVLREWQRADIRKIYDNPHGTRRAILSYGRKNSKTATSAFLLLAHLCGTEARPNSQLYSAAQSRDQAALLFNLAAKMVRMSPELQEFVGIRDTAKQLYCQELGTLYRALSAEASTAYGLSPVFIVHDELGQVRGPRSELYEALETATAAQEHPLSLIISTQAPQDSDLLSVLIDDAKAGHDPRVVISLYEASVDLDPFCESTIKLANPAFGDFQNPEEVLAMAQDAKRMPAREAEYRNLVLNQRIEASDPFVAPSVWDANAAPPRDDWDGYPVYAGLDLSDAKDLTALVLACVIDGELHVRPTFWLPHEGLAERSRKDSVPYNQWVRDGLIEATPGKSVQYEFVASRVVDLFESMDLRKVAFDRWNFRHFRPWLLKAGLSEEFVEERFDEFGQGFRSMSPALRELEALLLDGRVRHGANPVLTMCATNAVVTMDPAGNRKLDKKRATGRIDGMVALTMAASLASADTGDVQPMEVVYTPGEMFT